ncbi:MAG: M48 family metalloprotease [Candidatus Omnitrophica bacterium]|nr:M48 family metalloprotease [Candidatus Omnitrophota bacterium]
MSGESSREKSKRYSAIKTRLFVADIFLSVVAIGAFQFILSRPVSRFAFGLHENFYLACLIYLAAFLAFVYMVGLPLNFYGSFLVERDFGLSRQDLGGWLWDEVKSVLLSFFLYAACIEGFYLILRNFPIYWWLIAAAVWIFFSVFLTRIMPVVLIPLFYRYSPIEDDSLKKRIMSLAKKTHIKLTQVCQIDFSRKTSKANAALVGLGSTRKVILADTLVNGFEPDEVEAVVAHELGHQKYLHIWQLLAFSSLVTFAGFFLLSRVAGRIVAVTGASGLSDIYILPLLVLLMLGFGLVLLPVQNWFSRLLEKQADSFTLRITGNPDSFIRVMSKLADMNLAEIDPSFLKKIFMYNHPPINERIEMARRQGSSSINR